MLDDKIILHKAVQLLAQRDYSEFDLHKKLELYVKRQIIKATQKSRDNSSPLVTLSEYTIEIPENLKQKIANAVVYCQNHQWLDDHSYVEKYVRMRSRSGYGRNRIVLELKQKGLPSVLVDNIINESNIDWFAIAVQQLNKKFKSVIKQDLKQKAKIYRFLLSRGFLPEEVHHVYISL